MLVNAVVPNMDDQLSKAIQRLNSRMSRLEMAGTSGRGRGGGGRGRSRRSRSRSRQRGTVVAPMARSRPSTAMAGLGRIRLQGDEVLDWTTEVTGSSGGNVSLTPAWGAKGTNQSGAPAQLKALATLYSQYRYVKLRARYEPMCATTSNGAFSMAFDNAGQQTTTTTFAESTVLRTVPNVSGPVWKQSTLVCPKPMLISKNWFRVPEIATSAAGDDQIELMWWFNVSTTTSKTVYGRIWLYYEIEFTGFTKN